MQKKPKCRKTKMKKKPNTERDKTKNLRQQARTKISFLMIIKLMKPVGQPDWNAAINFAAEKKDCVSQAA